MKKQEKSLKERYLGLDELARYLGVDKKIIISKAEKGDIKLMKKGKDLFCPVQDLEELTRAFVSSEEISSIAKRMIDDYGSLFKRLA
ncbi:helix-turn-helix domain-containing protein [bacterium]|nr:helix-turn-helix domain-containing protein [bacterium]